MGDSRRFRIETRTLRIRDLKWGEGYHPALAWARWVVLFCFLFLAVMVLTGIIPQQLQPVTIVAFMSLMILALMTTIGALLKSFDRAAYPVLAGILIFAAIAMVIWVLGYGS